MDNASRQDSKMDKTLWINPIGGLGDSLMLSGILYQLNKKDPEKKFNLIRRTAYTEIFKDHPAISKIEFPSDRARIINTDYWSAEPLGAGNQRAYQILARIFGLKTPAEEILYLPRFQNNGENKLLIENIPWKKRNIILAPFSNSPRKTMHPVHWHQLVEMILSEISNLVIQVGNQHDTYIKNCYSLLGITNLSELASLVKKADLIITSDSLLMHMAHLTGTPAFVIWGPTSSSVYGYPEQVHFTASTDHCPERNKCLGPGLADNYSKPCPLNDTGHCMNRLDIKSIYTAAINILNR
jgi:ADP-heptose:LPS heptosyltransferase